MIGMTMSPTKTSTDILHGVAKNMLEKGGHIELLNEIMNYDSSYTLKMLESIYILSPGDYYKNSHLFIMTAASLIRIFKHSQEKLLEPGEN